MRYHWLRDQQQQNNFDIYWTKSEDNDADYYTKHLTARYHRTKYPTHILDKRVHGNTIHSQQPDQQGCISPGHTSPAQTDVSESCGLLWGRILPSRHK